MRLKSLISTIAATLVLLLSAPSWADFELYKDYELSKEIMSMTTVKVDAGKGEDYLEGLAQTWVASNEVAKDLGHIKDYNIYVSRLPDSGDFNVVLIVTMESMSDMVESKKKYNAFMKKWGERSYQQSKEIAKNYPELRTIVGEYILSRVELQ